MPQASIVPDIYEINGITASADEPIGGAVIERVEYGDGIRVFVQGHQFPYKTFPTIGAVHAIDVIKKLFLAWPSLPLKNIKAIGMVVLRPHILKARFMTACSRELRTMIPGELGILISHVIEYDSAYRLRLQDLMSESSAYTLGLFPIYEIKRLIQINGRRDYRSVHAKIRWVGYMLIVALCWPPFRKKWRIALLNCNFDNLQLDDNDKYWLNQRSDYGPNRTNE